MFLGSVDSLLFYLLSTFVATGSDWTRTHETDQSVDGEEGKRKAANINKQLHVIVEHVKVYVALVLISQVTQIGWRWLADVQYPSFVQGRVIDPRFFCRL